MFAVLCVLLAAGGHAMTTGMAPSVWVQAAGFVPVFAAGCLLGGRERSLAAIGTGTLASQGGLHLVFHAAEPRHAAMVMHGMRMVQSPHALTPHATAAHAGAALLLTWWLRRGEAALWSLLRWAVAFVPGLAAWWQLAGGAWSAPTGPGPVRRPAGEPWALRQVRLRYAVHRRGPPKGMSYAI
ncbi:hypothetical protein ACQ4WX_26230 [Streptomyces lasalocidi]